jgi:transcriptional regulator with AAA-type ATPase domain
MKDSLISILVFYTSPVRPALDSSENVRYFEAQSLTQAFQFLFQNTVDIILCSEAQLPKNLEKFLKDSLLTPLIDDFATPLSKVKQRLENQKLAQKNVSMNEQFEHLIQYGEWNLPDINLNDLEPIQLVCPPGAEIEAAALAIHLKSSHSQSPFEIYRFANQSDGQIENDLWGYFRQDENPVMDPGLLNRAGTLLFIDADRIPAIIQQKLVTSLKNIKKRLVAASPIPLLSLSKNGLYLKELSEYFSKQVISIPALEDRLFDLPAIAEQSLARLNKKYHLQVNAPNTSVMQALTAMHFENGYKELEAVLTLAALKRQKGDLTLEDLKA